MTNLDERIKNLEVLTRELAYNIIDHESFSVLNFTKFILNEVETPAMITDLKDNIVYVNPPLRELLEYKGVNVDQEDVPWWTVFWGDENPPSKDWLTKECMDGRKVLHKDLKSKLYKNKRYFITCVPLIYNGVSGVLSFLRVIDG
jgi:hypothetical protein